MQFPDLFWLWMVGAAAIGATTGLAVETELATELRRIGLLPFSAALNVLAISIILAQLIGGAFGFYATTAVCFLTVFLVAAAAGTLVVKRPLQMYKGWVWGLAPLALAWLVAVWSWPHPEQAEAKTRDAAILCKASTDAQDTVASVHALPQTPCQTEIVSKVETAPVELSAVVAERKDLVSRPVLPPPHVRHMRSHHRRSVRH